MNEAIASLNLTRQKVAACLDTFPAYSCPKCNNKVDDGVGAVVVSYGEEIIGFCKVCFVKMLKEHCGIVEFVPTESDKNGHKHRSAKTNTGDGCAITEKEA